MNANILHAQILNPPVILNQLHFQHYPSRSSIFTVINSTGNNSGNTSSEDGGNSSPTSSPPRITPPQTVGLRYGRGSRRKRRKQEEEEAQNKASNQRPPPVPKKWEEMNLTEKALELYVGEKGLLFWLNKFAYASIFIVIGAWILFRFVGPALNLYQLDSPPLPPEAILKGSR